MTASCCGFELSRETFTPPAVAGPTFFGTGWLVTFARGSGLACGQTSSPWGTDPDWSWLAGSGASRPQPSRKTRPASDAKRVSCGIA